jgi:nitroreductase
MTQLGLALDELLTTTRSVRRRLDLDRPVEPEIIEECLRIALQAPSGSNAQGWHWIVVTDPKLRAGIAEYYLRAATPYLSSRGAEFKSLGDERRAVQQRVTDSALYLAENLHRVPVHVLGCLTGDVNQIPAARQAGFWGSLFPAAWSFMLALRARGLGSAWTSLHLSYAAEVADLLGIPPGVSQGVLLPVAYTVGTDFRPAAREPLESVLHRDRW